MGTALKPAFEPCVLARKPLDGTVAANVARWGVGGLAIDACRIGNDIVGWGGGAAGGATWTEENCGLSKAGEARPVAGRWPANVLLDEEAAAALDVQADASRFFYTAKASRREREKGCESLPLKSAGEVTDREDGSAGLDNPRAGAGRTGGARNHHPTVKPLALTEYLARLILPPSLGQPRRILIPFAGSGSEMIGALKAGWDEVVGIEREAEYVEIANARLTYHNSMSIIPMR